MTSSSRQPVPPISAALPDEVRPALALVLRDLGDAQQGLVVDSLMQTRSERLQPFDALSVARKNGRLQGAVWNQPQPGNAAALWLPQFEAPVDAAGNGAVARKLVAAAMALSDRRGVLLSQALITPDDQPACDLLQANGFNAIAELRYLTLSLADREAGTSYSPLVVEAYDPKQRDRLARLLSKTYVDTLDCPGFEKLRPVDDVITGYEMAGVRDPSLWFFLTVENADKERQDVGVLLLNQPAGTTQIELTYMGVIPESRGHGYGRLAIELAATKAKERNAGELLLAVDASNPPAARLYEQAGFFEWARRVAYIRSRGG